MKRVFRCAIAVILSAIWISSTPKGSTQDAVPGDEANAEVKEKPKREYPPEFEEALKEFIAKCIEARRESARKEIGEVAEELAKFHQLDEKSVETIKERSEKAVESSLKPWGEMLKKFLWNVVEEEVGPDGEVLDEALNEFLKEVSEADPAEVIEEIPATGEARPDQQPEWQAILRDVLTAEQLAAWNQKAADEKAKLEEQFGKLIEVTSDNYKRQYGSQMDPLVEDIIGTAKLDELRKSKLKEAAESAIEQFVTEWKKSAAEYLEDAEESQRESMLSRGYISFGVDSDILPGKQKKWTEALDTILTKPEKEMWEKAIADRTSRRERAAKKMMIAAIDELMALTVQQRKKLEPLIEAKATSSLVSQLTRDSWGSLNVPRIVQYANTADQTKIEAILDDIQWKRWQSVMKTESRSRAEKPKEKKVAAKPPPGPNPVAMEAAVTAHLYRMMVAEREKILSNVLVRAEDAGRVVALSPEARASLRTAAKGAAEQAITTWANSMNSWVRRSIKGANPATIQERLKNLGSVRFGRSEKAHDSLVWKTAVSTHLNDDQRRAWQVEIDARKAYRSEALAALMITQLDNAARLTNEQVDQIGPLLATAIEEYSPDIDRYFASWSRDTPWYLNSYYSMIPFQGVPEKESKKILTKAQWTIWEERFETRVSHYWERVLQYHDQRTQAEAKEKEKKAKNKKTEGGGKAETVKES